ncbi:MAG TPA: G1 family glutamic endopeptidase [Micromonosporaceae bacterium]
MRTSSPLRRLAHLPDSVRRLAHLPDSVRRREPGTRPARRLARPIGLALSVGALALAGVTMPTSPAHPDSGRAAGPPAAFGSYRHYNVNGYNWGGHAASGSGFASVSATWRQPAATCNSTADTYAPWVGLDGYGSPMIEQTGVATDCSTGRAVHLAWYEFYPAQAVYLNAASYPVASGDVVHASVAYAGASTYRVTLSDRTRGWTFTTSRTVTASQASAEVIIESPPGRYPNFHSLTFTQITVNGRSLGNYSTVALDPSANGVFEAHTGALTGGGTAFTISYLRE